MFRLATDASEARLMAPRAATTYHSFTTLGAVRSDRDVGLHAVLSGSIASRRRQHRVTRTCAFAAFCPCALTVFCVQGVSERNAGVLARLVRRSFCLYPLPSESFLPSWQIHARWRA